MINFLFFALLLLAFGGTAFYTRPYVGDAGAFVAGALAVMLVMILVGAVGRRA